MYPHLLSIELYHNPHFTLFRRRCCGAEPGSLQEATFHSPVRTVWVGIAGKAEFLMPT